MPNTCYKFLCRWFFTEFRVPIGVIIIDGRHQRNLTWTIFNGLKVGDVVKERECMNEPPELQRIFYLFL